VLRQWHSGLPGSLRAALTNLPRAIDHPLPSAPQPTVNDPADAHAGAARRRLSLIDTTSIMIGIIIGAGLYETAPRVANNVSNEYWLIAAWALGGVYALLGALCYAELATAYPADGGDYVYLTRAFGRPAGFLFAWAQLWIIRPGSIGVMAYVFGRYATQLYALGEHSFDVYAVASVVVLTLINIVGLQAGKWTQNLLTAVKLAGLLGVVLVGFLAKAPAQEATIATPNEALAIIFVVFTYGGWNDLAFAAAEVRNPDRNISRALVLGTSAVMAIYVIVNMAFLHALSFDGVRASNAVAADAMAVGLGDFGRRGISVLVCISTLGSINGMILTGARVYYAMGRDHRLFGFLGRWNAKWGTPATSLVTQAACTLVAVVGFAMVEYARLGEAGAASASSGFERLVIFTTPVMWFFLCSTGVTLMVLRQREPGSSRAFRVPGYPFTPIVYCAGAAYIIWSSLNYALANGSWEAGLAVGLLAAGVPFAFLSRGRDPQA
jgi:APA family basic amino acid/polyamine antiporter